MKVTLKFVSVLDACEIIEQSRPMKTVVVILGASASGKSYLRQSLCKGEPVKCGTPMCRYTLYDNAGCVGTHNGGADKVGDNKSTLDGIFQAIRDVLIERDVCIVEGQVPTNSYKAIAAFLFPKSLRVVIHWHNPDEATNLQRLHDRSAKHGRVPKPSAIKRILAARRALPGKMEWLKENYPPFEYQEHP